MSADIIQFVPRSKRKRWLLEFAAATRSAFREDDLTMGHADTAPCEYVVSYPERPGEGERK
jgi:hypothetical protein